MSDATTAVLLARGLGTRMRRDDPGATLDAAQRRAADAGLKVMIPDRLGRPFLDHILTALADGGVTDVVVVTAPDHHPIDEHFTEHPPTRVQVRLAVQAEPRGTADAVLAAEPLIGDAPFLVLNADNLYPSAAIRALVHLGGPGVVGFDRSALLRASNIPPERTAAFALLGVDSTGQLFDLIEKPDADAGAHLGSDPPVSMNLWRFGPEIFAACRDVTPSVRGELELPEAVRLALHRGARYQVVALADGVLDLSARGDVAQVAQRLAARQVAT